MPALFERKEVCCVLSPVELEGLRQVRVTPAMGKVLKLMAFGYSDRRIAKELIMSYSTVRSHTTVLYQVLGAKIAARGDCEERAQRSDRVALCQWWWNEFGIPPIDWGINLDFLSPHENIILNLIGQGKSSWEIAKQLNIARKTLWSYRCKINSCIQWGEGLEVADYNRSVAIALWYKHANFKRIRT